MPSSLLRRLLGRAGASPNGAVAGEAFSLPGSLQPGARVLLLASDDLTDLLFAMPLVEAVHGAIEGVEFGLLCDERTSHLALSTDRFADVLVVDPQQAGSGSASHRELQEALQGESWDVAILLGQDPDPDRDEFAHLSGATLRMGPDHPLAFPRLNCQVRPPSSESYPYGRAQLWGRLLGVNVDARRLHWRLAPKRARQMGQLVHFNKPRKQQRLIGIDPGVGKAGTRLGAANLGLIANHLSRTIDSRTIVLTADEDPTVVDEFVGVLENTPLDLPRPTLLETVLLLNECDLLVSGNTDLLHFAAALDVPALTVFADADADAWIPDRAERLEVVRAARGEALDLAEIMDRVERLLA
ncbi:MAG TPA: glycosyltransferase family 9 protein [Candidatus Krumholzibacteria bacterium]|nr:glycosyltransferase family 9 protein [Candidatus Krumholzibacteria bacterium]